MFIAQDVSGAPTFKHYNQIFQIETTWLSIPSSKGQTSSLFTGVAKELNSGLSNNLAGNQSGT